MRRSASDRPAGEIGSERRWAMVSSVTAAGDRVTTLVIRQYFALTPGSSLHIYIYVRLSEILTPALWCHNDSVMSRIVVL